MNLLIVSPIFPPEIGGPATYVSELATRLTHLGHKVTVVAFSNRAVNFVPRTSYLVQKISTSENFLTRQASLLFAIVKHARQADVIYAQGTIVVGVASLIASKLLQKKLIVKFVGDEIWEAAFNSNQTKLSLEQFYLVPSTSYFARLLLFLHRLVLKSAHQVIVPSQYLKQFLISSHQIKDKKITIIPNAVEPLKKVSSKVPHQSIVVGRLAKTKHVDLIINAFIKANIPKSKLLIVGDGPERKALEKLRTSYLVPRTDIIFTGSVPAQEVAKLVASSSKLILMSSYEGQSHTLIQALLHQTGIICSDIPPNRELCGTHAIYTQPTVDHIASALLKNPPILSKTDLETKINIHSWSHHLNRLSKVMLK
jgi:glycosyltransferase involved in cell wall biosynthesis